MDNFLQLAEDRFSVRKFIEKQLRVEDLARILKAGEIAPTAKNVQPQKIFVVQSEQGLAKIDLATKCRYGAPTVLMVCYDRNLEWVNPFNDQYTTGVIDATIVTTHMMLEAWDIGVASCYVEWFNPDKLISEFELPENIIPAALLPLGYMAPEAHPAHLHSESREEEEMVQFL